MKTKLLFLFFTLTLLSCSSDDNSGGDSSGNGNFFPQQQGNFWVYDVNSEQGSGRDSLYISGTNTTNGQTYQTFATQDNMPVGFYSGVMTSGESRTSGSKVFINGSISMGDVFGGDFGDLGIDFQDFLFFDGGSSQGQTLDSESGEFEIPYSEEISFTVEYTLSAKTGQDFSNYSIPNGDSYENVKSVTVAVSVKITANLVFSGFPISYPLLNTQDIISSTQYYADNVGMIYANTDIQYNLNEIPIDGFELPVPESYFSNMKEVLDNYSVE